jgi:hypothetical protein
MTLDQERPAVRQCPHCGCANAVEPGARECPCCGQGYGAQGLVDHLPMQDENASLAPAALGAAAAVALAVVAAFALGLWALLAVIVFVSVIVVSLVAARRA